MKTKLDCKVSRPLKCASTITSHTKCVFEESTLLKLSTFLSIDRYRDILLKLCKNMCENYPCNIYTVYLSTHISKILTYTNNNVGNAKVIVGDGIMLDIVKEYLYSYCDEKVYDI